MPTVQSCVLSSRPDGSFDVVIRGHNLGPGAVPPVIRVGGRPVRRLAGTGGTELRGVVDGGEPGDEVVIDLGPAGRARTTVERVA